MVYKLVAISGSVSKSSTSSGLIRAALLAHCPNVSIEVLDVSGFPLFNMDPIIDNGFPEQVKLVREKVNQAHGVIFVTPEHNSKVSAVLKNAYDWISFTPNAEVRPPIKEKPGALIVVSSESSGEKAQFNFKRVCEYCKIKLIDKALLVKQSQGDFDSNGNVLNKNIGLEVEKFINRFLQFLQEIKA